MKLNQLINTTATGAVSGAFWGTLIGLIFLNPLIGTAVGAASGALGGKLTKDVGINDDFMRDTASALQPGVGRPVSADQVDDCRQGPQGVAGDRRCCDENLL